MEIMITVRAVSAEGKPCGRRRATRKALVFGPDSIYSSVSTDASWSTLTAVKNGNYYEVPDSPYNWMGMPPSVNRYLGMQWFANLCYPETFDYDMYEVTKEYYKTFYNYDLTQDEYNELTANAVRK